ncbi:auxin-responsive protein SAUR32-like [Carica papaya]|uniref:auxin-responsive protein SAUR32-like n=1 Tax=Carica papaya TaxID=3649 RepID=UPI000B8C8424|nr:auxin-responsive protein SAUR32-like [Carica papaya]
MCLSKKSWGGRYEGIMRIRLALKKLQTGLSFLLAPRGPDYLNYFRLNEDLEAEKMDVMKGHFVVIAVKGGTSKRFMVELSCLTNPAFLKLLEKAKEEFGFEQKGPIAIPCKPEEVQKILDEWRKKSLLLKACLHL